MLSVDLEPGEAVKAEPGGNGLTAGRGNADRHRGGGLFGGFKRMLGGESFFVNTFTGGPFGGHVGLAPNSPGDISSFDVDPGTDLFVQSGPSWLVP